MNNSTQNSGNQRMPVMLQISSAKIGESEVQTVNARQLHAFLEIGKDFSNWIKDRIEQYSFSENSDFVVFANSGDNSRGGRPAKEYAISIDMAKELAMVERNEKGKQARQYFIECERQAKQVDPVAALNDPAAMRGILLTYCEKVLTLQEEVKKLEPKAEALDRIATAEGSLCITDAAKTLQIQPKKLTKFLLENKWIYQRPMHPNKLGYADKMNQGLLEHKYMSGDKSDGSEWNSTQVRITAKGLTKLSQMLGSSEVAA
jgi:anti-repressor protein